MQIEFLKVSSIKSLENMFFSPNPHLNVLTGANNSGKSTILQSLRTFQSLKSGQWPFSGDSLDVVTEKRANVTPEVILNVRYEPEDLAQIHPIFQSSLPRHFTFCVSVPVHTNSRGVSLELIDSDSMNTGGAGIIRKVANGFQHRIANGSLSSFGGDVYGEIRKPLTDSDRIIALDPLRLFLNNIFFYDPFRAISESVNFAGPQMLEASGGSLARPLARWRLSQDDRWDRYCHLVQLLCPGLGTLITDTPNDSGNLFIGFRKGNTVLNVTSMGTGVQQMLVLAYQLVAKETHFLALEEPESHLHPTAQRALFRAIKEASSWCQVFLTTHSPLFVDRFNYENNWIVYQDKYDRTSINQLLTPDPFRPIRDVLGVSLGDTLFAGDTIIVAEGPTEQIVLPIMTEKARQAGKPFIDFNRVSIVNAGGIGNVPSMIRILKSYNVPIFVLLDNANNTRQKVKALVNDGLVDNQSITIVKRLNEDGNPIDILPAEIEDVLPLNLYLASLNERYEILIDVAEYESTVNKITNERKGSIPHRPDVVERILTEIGTIANGDDYDKVGVALRTVQQMSVEEIPAVFYELAEKISNALTDHNKII